jgi:hypothetical protein
MEQTTRRPVATSPMVRVVEMVSPSTGQPKLKEGEMKQPKDIHFFANGNTMAFDKNGEQIPKLQQSWFLLYLKFLESEGIDVISPKYTLPNGRSAAPFKTDGGKYNWQIGG